MKSVPRKNAVYAMLNVRVGEFGRTGARNKTLRTIGTTVIKLVHNYFFHCNQQDATAMKNIPTYETHLLFVCTDNS